MVGGGGAFMAGAIVSKLILDTTAWNAQTKAVVSRTARLGTQLGKIGATLSKSVTLPLTILGGIAVKTAADFEQKLVNAFSVTGSTSETVKQQMSDLAREMGATTVFAATEAADAMYYMASAGWKADDMANALKDTLDLAAATQTDLAFATETVISTLNQFQLGSEQANRVSNVFASAISNSQATMDRLGISMSYAGPIMKAMGYTVEETSAVLMQMYNSGIKASTAGTALRMGMLRLLTPTRKSSDALKRMGLTFEQVNPETHKLADILDLVGERMTSTRDIADLFGTRAAAAFAALASKGGGALRDFEKKITGTQRATEMAEMQIDTFKGSMKLLTSALTETGISFGNMIAPAVRKFADSLRGLITKFNELGPETKAFIGRLMLIAAAIGPLTMLVGKLLILFAKLKAALIASKAAFLMSAAGVGILTAALGALVIGYMKVTEARDKAIASARTAAEVEDKLAEKLKRVADAAGVSNKEFAQLLKKYKYMPAAMAMAIKKGKEGVELQKALATESKKHREEIEKQKAAMDATGPTLEELARQYGVLADEIEDTTEKAESWTDYLESIGLQTISDKSVRVSILESHLEKLAEAYRKGEIDLKSFIEATNKAKQELLGLSTTITTTAIPAARNMVGVYSNAVGTMETRTGEFTEIVKEKNREATTEVKKAWINVSTVVSDLANKWSDALVGSLGVVKWFYDEATEFDNSYYENAIENIEDKYEKNKSALEQELVDIEGHYNDIISKEEKEYENKKRWIKANVTNEEERIALLDNLEDKHQAKLEEARTNQQTKEDELRNKLVEIEKNYQTDLEAIRKEEELAREEHRKDELEKEKSVWNQMKKGFGVVIEDMLKMWMTQFLGGLLTDTKDTIGKIGKLFSGLFGGGGGGGIAGTAGGGGGGIGGLLRGGAGAGGIWTGVGAAVGTVVGNLLTGGGPSKTNAQDQLHEQRLIKQCLLNITEHELTWILDEIKSANIRLGDFCGERIPIKQDTQTRLLDSIEGFTDATAHHTDEIIDQLRHLRPAQRGAVFTGTELAVMHGTPSQPEIAAPMPMLEKFVAAKGRSGITINPVFQSIFKIEINDQIDPHSAQRIMRDQMLPQFLQAVEVNDKQSRTKLEEILKLRV